MNRKEVISESLLLQSNVAESLEAASHVTKVTKLAKLTALYQNFMDELGIPKDANSKETAFRVSKMMLEERCAALHTVEPRVTTFPMEAGVGYDEYVVIKDVPYYSVCSHHHVTFSGTVDVAYHPDNLLLGASKVARVVQYFASKPQIQEGLTEEIAEFLAEKLKPKGLIVRVKGEHMCMTARGAKSIGSNMVTQKVMGVMDKAEVAQLFSS